MGELREPLPVRLELVEPVRRDPRRKQSEHDEEAGDHGPHQEHRACEAARLGERAERPPKAKHPRLCLSGGGDGHQYRILGSMAALTRSIMRLATTTTSAKTTMIP